MNVDVYIKHHCVCYYVITYLFIQCLWKITTMYIIRYTCHCLLHKMYICHCMFHYCICTSHTADCTVVACSMHQPHRFCIINTACINIIQLHTSCTYKYTTVKYNFSTHTPIYIPLCSILT